MSIDPNLCHIVYKKLINNFIEEVKDETDVKPHFESLDTLLRNVTEMLSKPSTFQIKLTNVIECINEHNSELSKHDASKTINHIRYTFNCLLDNELKEFIIKTMNDFPDINELDDTTIISLVDFCVTSARKDVGRILDDIVQELTDKHDAYVSFTSKIIDIYVKKISPAKKFAEMTRVCSHGSKRKYDKIANE
jgi:hypothetical protein